MKALTKTTMNFANKRGIDLQVVTADEIDSDYGMLWLFTDMDDSEPSIYYVASEDGSYYNFAEVNGVSAAVKEELPATIFNEKQLRKVVEFIAENK